MIRKATRKIWYLLGEFADFAEQRIGVNHPNTRIIRMVMGHWALWFATGWDTKMRKNPRWMKQYYKGIADV